MIIHGSKLEPLLSHSKDFLVIHTIHCTKESIIHELFMVLIETILESQRKSE